MQEYTPDDTISSSKEESIAKAIQMMQGSAPPSTPLVRPKISTTKILLSFFLWLILFSAFLLVWSFVGEWLQLPGAIRNLVSILWCLLILAIKAKAMICNAILLYQKYAPERMRKSCLFVPSCSQYMLLAIDKYGVLRGVCKGIHRLSRCHHPNGGVDYP